MPIVTLHRGVAVSGAAPAPPAGLLWPRVAAEQPPWPPHTPRSHPLHQECSSLLGILCKLI